MKNTVVHLLGFPGVGKLTIAKLLEPKIDAVLIDAHHINNPVFKTIQSTKRPDMPDKAWDLTHKIRKVVMEAMETCGLEGANYIFTNVVYANDAEDLRKHAELLESFNRMKLNYVPIRLMCDEEELVKRRVAPGRRENFKDTNPDLARKEIRERGIIETGHHNELTLNITNMAPEATVEAICRHLQKVAA